MKARVADGTPCFRVAAMFLPLCFAVLAKAQLTEEYQPSDGVLSVNSFENWLLSQPPFSRLRVAPGVYNVTTLVQGVHVPLLRPLADVVIDMSGVTLVMQHRSNTALKVSNWRNVTLLGLTLKYAEHPTNQAVVASVNAATNTMIVDVPTGYPLDDWNAGKSFSCNVYYPQTRYLRVGAGDLYSMGATKTTSARRFAVRFRDGVSAVRVGDTLGCRNAAFAFTVHVDGCTRSTFSDIILLGGPGFGFFHGHPKEANENDTLARLNMGGNTFSRLQLTYPPRPEGATAEPVLSASADAFHANGVPVGPVIEHSLFEGHNDDGIALHGSYSLVVDHTNLTRASGTGLPTQGQRMIWVTSGDFAIGNKIKLYDTNFAHAGDAIVTAVQPAQPMGHYAPPYNTSHTMPNKRLLPEPQGSYEVLTIAEGTPGAPLPAALRFDWVVFNMDRGCNTFLVRNNTIRNHRARGMLIKASDGVIEGNAIENSTLGGIVVTPELYWGEGDFVSNLTIESNSVRSVCIGLQCYGGLALGAKDPAGDLAPFYGHQDVRIVRNRFENISQMNLWISSSQRVEVTGNTIVGPFAYTPVATCCPPYPFPHTFAAWVTTTKSGNISDNCVFYPPPVSQKISLFNVTDSVVDVSIDRSGGFRVC